MGFQDEFTKNAEANIKAFQERRASKTIVTPCSDCYHAFKRQYAKLGHRTSRCCTRSNTSTGSSAQGKLTFTKTLPMTVTYHDPCHLGRLGEPYVAWNGQGEEDPQPGAYLGAPAPPLQRRLRHLRRAPRRHSARIPGVELVEMERIREYSWCCGAGGGCSDTSPEFSAWTASERITEANATGAEALVTACPWCESNFRDATDENGKKIDVLDIIELVEKAL